MNFGDKLIVLNDLNVNDDNNQEVKLKKNDLISFICIYYESQDMEEWRFFPVGSEEAQIVIPGSVVKDNIANYFEYYQKQFNNLPSQYSYFGQLSSGNLFFIQENGKKYLCGKIDEYMTSDGKIYNTYRLPNMQGDYWAIDDEETYKNKDFLYLNPDQKIEGQCYNHIFIAPEIIKVCEYFIEFPKMLDVVECFFKKEELSDELRQEYETYKKYKSDEEACMKDYGSIPINTVMKEFKEKNENIEKNNIMAEIDRETEKFRQELINKRLKCRY